jgi:hypothetical protein
MKLTVQFIRGLLRTPLLGEAVNGGEMVPRVRSQRYVSPLAGGVCGEVNLHPKVRI